MQIIDFTVNHIKAAVQLAKQNYEDERGFVPALPPVDRLPDLNPYAENGLGVAAFEDGTMIGFLCSVPPFKNAFRSTDATGVFSPMGANGAIGENRTMIYARLYQAAGEKWVRAGASSHAVCLYAHDREVQEQFQSVYFTAKYEEQIVAFVRAELDGENFICNTPGYLHVKGAYCLPEHRGKGLNQKLLSMLMQKLKTKGYTRLGVDFESLNPTAYGFWLKYFDAYTHSVVRRIDEKILEM